MIITKVERQKKNPSRISLHIDDEYAIGVHKEVFLKSGLRKGDHVTEETLSELKRKEEHFHARQSALRLLSYRARSRKEIRDRLKKKSVSEPMIESVLHSLEEAGLIDDLEFARAFAHDKLLKKPMGKALLKQELRKKGIRKEIIEQVLSESFPESSELDYALELASKRMKRSRPPAGKIEAMKDKKRLSDYLARRGFDWETVNKAVRKVLDGRNAQDEDYPDD